MAFSATKMNAYGLAIAEHDWVNDTWVFVVCDVAHTHNLADTTYGDLASVVASVALTGKTVTNSGTNNYLDCNDIDLGGTYSAKHGYIVHQAGGALAGTDKLLGYYDLNVGNSSNIQVPQPLVVNANGVFNLA